MRIPGTRNTKIATVATTRICHPSRAGNNKIATSIHRHLPVGNTKIATVTAARIRHSSRARKLTSTTVVTARIRHPLREGSTEIAVRTTATATVAETILNAAENKEETVQLDDNKTAITRSIFCQCLCSFVCKGSRQTKIGNESSRKDEGTLFQAFRRKTGRIEGE